MSFIFQAIPERYKLPRELNVGKKVFWVASRYRDLMKRGEVVYFWFGGNPARKGFYGWGIIIGEAPVLYKNQGYRIEVEYHRNFLNHEQKPGHISAEKIRKDPVLRNHLIFRMAIGTNFLLTVEEDQALRTIISNEFGPNWVPPRSTDNQRGEEHE